MKKRRDDNKPKSEIEKQIVRLESLIKPGRETFIIRPRAATALSNRTPHQNIARFSSIIWHNTSNPQLNEIDEQTARQVLRNILMVGMVFGFPLRSQTKADKMIDYFFALFKGNARYFTNTSVGANPHLNAWIPVTGATFDQGVVAIDEDYIGLLWAEEED